MIVDRTWIDSDRWQFFPTTVCLVRSPIVLAVVIWPYCCLAGNSVKGHNSSKKVIFWIWSRLFCHDSNSTITKSPWKKQSDAWTELTISGDVIVCVSSVTSAPWWVDMANLWNGGRWLIARGSPVSGLSHSWLNKSGMTTVATTG